MAYILTACPTCSSLNVSLTLGTSSANYRRCDECGDMWTERLTGAVRATARDEDVCRGRASERESRQCGGDAHG
jgi:uncharacterized Zn finger protein